MYRSNSIPARNNNRKIKSDSQTYFTNKSGLYLARVVDNADPAYDGNIWVEIVGQNNTNSEDTQESRQSTYTKIRSLQTMGGTINGENFSTQYGSSFSPPEVGTEILVGFGEGQQEGFLFGSLTPTGKNASIPGLSASPLDEDPDVIAPTLEASSFEAQSGNQRVRHPIAERIAEQGTALDPIRGIGSEGARRESPSRVSGFSSPGGHSFVMDDGTVAYSEGVNHTPDQSRKAGTNNLIRLRSGGGAQLLLNDEAGIVYVVSQNGNGWIQIDADGNVDIYSAKNVSIHSGDTINFYAADAFNVEADVINMKSRGDSINLESGSADINLLSSKNIKLTSGLNLHEKSGGDIIQSSDGNIHLNGPVAESAEPVTPEPLPVNRGVKESIVGRIPEHEPYGGHGKNSFYVAAQARSSKQTGTSDLSTEA